jgi:hypothetical protein
MENQSPELSEDEGHNGRLGQIRLPDDDTREDSRLLNPDENDEYTPPRHHDPSTSRWERIKDAIPEPIHRIADFIAIWSLGPQPAKIQRIKPWFPSVQRAPIVFMDTYLPKRIQRFWALLGFYFAWIFIFVLILRVSASTIRIPHYGHPTQISCYATYW